MLEVEEFSHQTNRFDFREIEFREEGALSTPFTISQIGGLDGKCLLCHTEQRPIWETYDIWPGFYGGDDDFPFNRSPKRGRSVLDVEFPNRVSAEWDASSAGPLHSGRYQYLQS